ncbi:MAG: trehalose-phosphatase [Terriglobales bacterium]
MSKPLFHPMPPPTPPPMPFRPLPDFLSPEIHPTPPPGWRPRLRAARRILLASDFDGTLAAIAPQPELARPLPGALAVLAALARRRDFRVALVSGRGLDDLRQRCPVEPGWFVGGHGIEFEGPDGSMPSQGHAAQRQAIAEMSTVLQGRLPGWPGARLEAKPFSVAVHFRQAPEWGDRIRHEVGELATRDPAGRFRVMLGRQVIELLPAQALTKGHAVQRLRSRLDCDLAFYFGDDRSDEDVFQLGDPAIIGVKVDHGEGPAASTAQYKVDSPTAVIQALQAISTERPEKKSYPAGLDRT